ncbi:MAG: isomerizing glutamine--fructose-6-phosphate transaminase [Terriglobia bacterium]|jgi:glucosamine--fructose-6-phosphate aminotransferase (isomerizing)|nr:isomerizing glutamine--fructose-6-phosphate transaminase [Terriglobia bacterium]
MSTREFSHHMLKEIFENPAAVRQTIAGRVSPDDEVVLEGLHLESSVLRELRDIVILASGTSRHAGLMAKIMIEKLASLPVTVDYASEFEYSDATECKNGELAIFITQSGETADTLAALRRAASCGARTLAIVNVEGSSLARAAESVLYTHAGKEIAVASTKTFTAQMAACLLLAIHLGRVRGTMNRERERELLSALRAVPEKVEAVLAADSACQSLAEKYAIAADFLFLGRSIHFPVAADGALKLKETSYIHAEAYPTGEIKHGPYALIDGTMPVVFIATRDGNDSGSARRYDMTVQNMRDVKERGARVIAIVSDAAEEVHALTKDVITVPSAPELLLPLVEIVPLQLFAYHVARLRGVDVDRPRNLVKAVTRE